MSTIPNNFLGLPAEYSDYKRARFAVLPIPYDSTTSFQVGTRNGPAAIIRCSQQVELFDDELEAECYECGIATLDPIAPHMAGPKEMHEELHTAARKIVRDGKFLFGLGGEHSVTSALVRAVAAKYKKLSVLQIDAHLDLRDEWEGSPYSHASVMRRIHDMGIPFTQVGIRNVSADEHRFLKKYKLSPIMARDCMNDDDWIDRALAGLTENVFVTIDIDGFDPAYAPGTGTPEPGGLDWHQALSLLRLVTSEKNVVGADIVEVLPIPGQAVTEFLAARLAYKLMAYVQHPA